MRIAVVFPSFTGPYGAERLVLNLCQELIEMGNQLTLFTPKYDHRCDSMIHPDLEIAETGHIRRVGWDLSKLYEHYSVARIYRRLADDFDVINVHNYPSHFAAALAKKLKGISAPLVYQCNEPPRFLHDLSEETYQRLDLFKRLPLLLLRRLLTRADRWAVGHVDEVITISGFMQEQIRRIYQRDSVLVMPGTETKKINPSVDGRKVARTIRPNDEFVALTCNKLHPRKRIDVLIRSVPHIVEKRKDIRVIITGDGMERQKLQKLIAELDVQQYVQLVGFVTEEELPEYYAACDVFVFTAIREPQIGSPAEALAAGKPVIAPNDGSPAETIIEGETGWLFKPADAEELAGRIVWCMENREALPRMAQPCREWVEQNMTWGKMARETYEVFRRLVRNG
jgi:glycosyltransferase involved in cell wall biosynthesis